MDNINKQIIKKFTAEDALNKLRVTIEPKLIASKAIRIIEKYDNTTDAEKEQLASKHSKLLDQFIRIHEFEKHILLAESLPAKYGSLSIKMTDSIIAEYSCSTTLEKSLVEIIVSSFCRSLYLSTLLSNILNRESVPVEQNFVNHYNFIGKELDRANREYLTALTALQQLKSPRLNVNLKADTAIVG